MRSSLTFNSKRDLSPCLPLRGIYNAGTGNHTPHTHSTDTVTITTTLAFLDFIEERARNDAHALHLVAGLLGSAHSESLFLLYHSSTSDFGLYGLRSGLQGLTPPSTNTWSRRKHTERNLLCSLLVGGCPVREDNTSTQARFPLGMVKEEFHFLWVAFPVPLPVGRPTLELVLKP